MFEWDPEGLLQAQRDGGISDKCRLQHAPCGIPKVLVIPETNLQGRHVERETLVAASPQAAPVYPFLNVWAKSTVAEPLAHPRTPPTLWAVSLAFLLGARKFQLKHT